MFPYAAFVAIVANASGFSGIGAILSPYLPDRLLKTVFGLCIHFIASVHVVTSVQRLWFSA